VTQLSPPSDYSRFLDALKTAGAPGADEVHVVGQSGADRPVLGHRSAGGGCPEGVSGDQGVLATEHLAYAGLFVAYRDPPVELTQPHSETGVAILTQPMAEIPWYHNVGLLEEVKDPAQRLWYAAKTLEHGWSRAVLAVQIESDLYEGQGKAVNNFSQTLPPPHCDLAQQSLKDPYLFDFVTLHAAAVERDLEMGLVDHIQRFLIELGAGFAFVGRQVHLAVGRDDFYIDVLCYHLKLRCFLPNGRIQTTNTNTLERHTWMDADPWRPGYGSGEFEVGWLEGAGG